MVASIRAASPRAIRYPPNAAGADVVGPRATVRDDQLWRQVSEKLVPSGDRAGTVARVVVPVMSVIVIESFVYPEIGFAVPLVADAPVNVIVP